MIQSTTELFVVVFLYHPGYDMALLYGFIKIINIYKIRFKNSLQILRGLSGGAVNSL